MNQSQDESLESLTSRVQNVKQSEEQHQDQHHQQRYSVRSSRSRNKTNYYRPPSAHSFFGSSLLGYGVAVIPSSDEWSECGRNYASHEKVTSSIDDDESVASLYIDNRTEESEDDDELDDFHSVHTHSRSHATSVFSTMVGTQSLRSVSMSPRTVISDDVGSGSFATALLAPPVRTVSLSPAPLPQSASFSTTQIVTTTTTTTTSTTTTTRTSFLTGRTAASSAPMMLVSDDDQSFQSLCDDQSTGSNDGYYSVGPCELEQANSFDSDMMCSAVPTAPVSPERQISLGTTVSLDKQHLEDDNDKESGAAALSDTAMLEYMSCSSILEESGRKDPLAEVVATVQSVRSGQTDLRSGGDDDVWLADSSDSSSVNALHSGSDDDVWLGDSSDTCSVNALHCERDAYSRKDSSTVERNEHATMHSASSFSGAVPPASSPSDTHLASTSSSRPIDHPPTRTAAHIDSPTYFCAGDRVFIHGGTYKGKNGTVSHLTAKTVAVVIDGLDPKSHCLAPRNVALQERGQENGVSARRGPLHRCSQQRQHSRGTGTHLSRVGALDQIPN
jgi:hypothetical protein